MSREERRDRCGHRGSDHQSTIPQAAALGRRLRLKTGYDVQVRDDDSEPVDNGA
jgi:hypothetical protein